jgi:hypothetical protein
MVKTGFLSQDYSSLFQRKCIMISIVIVMIASKQKVHESDAA